MKTESSLPQQEATSADDDPSYLAESHNNGKKNAREKPLKIKGTLDDVLRAAMNVKPKDEQVRTHERKAD